MLADAAKHLKVADGFEEGPDPGVELLCGEVVFETT
jgi:hypothetical protein